MEILYGVLHAPCIKRNGVNGRVPIGKDVVFLTRIGQSLRMVCGWRLLLVGGSVLSGKELV